jgi:hypothetical protein
MKFGGVADVTHDEGRLPQYQYFIQYLIEIFQFFKIKTFHVTCQRQFCEKEHLFYN